MPTTPLEQAAAEQRLRGVLDAIIDPNSGQTLAATGLLKPLKEVDGRWQATLQLGYPCAGSKDELQAEVAAALKEAGVSSDQLTLNVTSRVSAHEVQKGLSPLPGVKNVIAVASGKGGVGKSTTAVNLALALLAEGARVGVLDADIYGPSIPRMLGVSGKPDTSDGRYIEPKIGHGLQAMSIGLMIEEDTPMIWRGPMVTQALQQMLTETRWDALDYLIIDLPPGTGDIQLTLCQKVPVSAALIVTTPQDIALLDARKALKMFEKVEVPVLGVIENMSTHVCSSCGHVEPIFGAGGGARMSDEYGVPLLGSLPLELSIREQADSGFPTVASFPESAAAIAYRAIARAAAARLSLRSKNKAFGFPEIVIQNT